MSPRSTTVKRNVAWPSSGCLGIEHDRVAVDRSHDDVDGGVAEANAKRLVGRYSVSLAAHERMQPKLLAAGLTLDRLAYA